MPFVTYLTMLAALLNFLYIKYLEKRENSESALIHAGALSTPYIGGWKQCYRFFTAGLVHMSLYHLIMNLYCLYSIGTTIEYIFGHLGFAILLFGSIILGNIFAVLLEKGYVISGGLSSGIYGLLAVELILIYLIYGIEGITQNTSLLITILINVSLNFMPGVGWKAHLGGATFGILFMTIIYNFF